MKTATPYLKQSYQMIAVNKKPATFRRALAQGKITVSPHAFKLIQARQLPKGDALQLAEIAGIMGAKKTADMIPLCHPLSLDHVRISTQLDQATNSITVFCQVAATAKTGVEMEALAGVNAALLTIYDLTKMIEPALTISDVLLLFKEGGKKGLWINPQGIPDHIQLEFEIDVQHKALLKSIKTATITASDRASANLYPDKSGELLNRRLVNLGANICNHTILPDNKIQVKNHIYNMIKEHEPRLIVITGGTGLDPKDLTPSVLHDICERIVPGIGELLRHDGAQYNERSWLSCSVAGTIDNTLIISLPGSTNAVGECIDILQKILPHALYMAAGGKHD